MESVIRCIIVEDDALSREVIEGLVERAGFLQLQQSFSDPVKAVHWLSSNTTDLIILDMEMPGMTGLEMLQTLTQKPQVIVISSKAHYAVDAIDYSIAAYLLKPVQEYAKFLKAVMKVKERMEATALPADHIFIKADSMLTNVSLSDITWVESFGDYVKVNTEKKVYTIYSTLKAVEDKLPSTHFIRVHRQFIVNLSKIQNIEQTNLQIDKKIIPIGTSFREQLMKRISTL
ncbi:MAG: LytR/AlgR family response regulator transcription factor [Cyclobacteriaceae bacterium]|jgi:DNA-binding LytR/AlgR family response regulator|nr:LytTR family DNA-binding domain-containing protein [Flammeovirgaceae bacterium]